MRFSLGQSFSITQRQTFMCPLCDSELPEVTKDGRDHL